MRVIKAVPYSTQYALEEASMVLSEGGVAAFCTETFYALGARFDSDAALRRVYNLKRRAEGKPLPLIIGSYDMLDMLAHDIRASARILMEKHWPGPLTLILKAREGLSPLITLNSTVAVRMPGESFALRLVRMCGFPVTATSANPSSEPPSATAWDVQGYFKDGLDLLVDSGPAEGSLPSTLADAQGDAIRVIREGKIKASDL